MERLHGTLGTRRFATRLGKSTRIFTGPGTAEIPAPSLPLQPHQVDSAAPLPGGVPRLARLGAKPPDFVEQS